MNMRGEQPTLQPLGELVGANVAGLAKDDKVGIQFPADANVSSVVDLQI